jgi:hypothetical protein
MGLVGLMLGVRFQKKDNIKHSAVVGSQYDLKFNCGIYKQYISDPHDVRTSLPPCYNYSEYLLTLTYFAEVLINYERRATLTYGHTTSQNFFYFAL